MVLIAESERPRPPLVVPNEKWGEYSTQAISKKLPPVLQRRLSSLIPYVSERALYTAVTDWSLIPPEEQAHERSFVLFLPSEFVQDPNLLAQAAQRWGGSDHAVVAAESSGFGESVDVLSCEPRSSLHSRQTVCSVPVKYDGRIFIPDRRTELTSLECSILALGAVDEEAYQLVQNKPEIAFGLLGPETYAYYVGRFDSECEERSTRMHRVMGQLLIDSQRAPLISKNGHNGHKAQLLTIEKF